MTSQALRHLFDELISNDMTLEIKRNKDYDKAIDITIEKIEPKERRIKNCENIINLTNNDRSIDEFIDFMFRGIEIIKKSNE